MDYIGRQYKPCCLSLCAHFPGVMASTLTLVIMVLPVTLLFLQETYALNVVQERRDPLECDRRHRRALCAYREGCSCHPRAPLGGWSRLHYRFENGRCSRGAFVQNCNGFVSEVACHSACIRPWGPWG
uniref:Pancreatic trypsin inhibitor n=1 Tax=Rhipicephalus appendiculatus TaxID=34631 RepID=A0A131Z781_RHIAP